MFPIEPGLTRVGWRREYRVESNDRRRPGIATLAAVLTAACIAVSPDSLPAAERKIVGALARVEIIEAGAEFLGRVDTGAKTTSLHALDLSVADGRVNYTTVNSEGESRSLSSEIVKQTAVKNADASEERYFVYLTLRFQGETRKILVNLNDRSSSAYKLLLGRNWLSGSYLVDVDR